jgi:hypothetical protein
MSLLLKPQLLLLPVEDGRHVLGRVAGRAVEGIRNHVEGIPELPDVPASGQIAATAPHTIGG